MPKTLKNGILGSALILSTALITSATSTPTAPYLNLERASFTTEIGTTLQNLDDRSTTPSFDRVVSTVSTASTDSVLAPATSVQAYKGVLPVVTVVAIPTVDKAKTSAGQAKLTFVAEPKPETPAKEAAKETTSTKSTASKSTSSPSSTGDSSAPTSSDGLSAKEFAEAEVARRGWSAADMTCLVKLWNKESRWNHKAENPSSGAYGIPQALPGNKMASAGADWRTNPQTQVKWGLDYIAGRYGTPCNAWAHSVQVNWY